MYAYHETFWRENLICFDSPLNGGRGTVVGALLGSLILATIAKALPLIPFFNQLWLNTIKGIIILVVVVMNVILQRIADKNALKGREM